MTDTIVLQKWIYWSKLLSCLYLWRFKWKS